MYNALRGCTSCGHPTCLAVLRQLVLDDVLEHVAAGRELHHDREVHGREEDLAELHDVGVHHAQAVVQDLAQHALVHARAALQELYGHLARASSRKTSRERPAYCQAGTSEPLLLGQTPIWPVHTGMHASTHQTKGIPVLQSNPVENMLTPVGHSEAWQQAGAGFHSIASLRKAEHRDGKDRGLGQAPRSRAEADATSITLLSSSRHAAWHAEGHFREGSLLGALCWAVPAEGSCLLVASDVQRKQHSPKRPFIQIFNLPVPLVAIQRILCNSSIPVWNTTAQEICHVDSRKYRMMTCTRCPLT